MYIIKQFFSTRYLTFFFFLCDETTAFPLKSFNWLEIIILCCYHVSMSSVIYSWTDAWQHGVFVFSNGRWRSGKLVVDLVRFQAAIWKMSLYSSPLGEKRSQARGPRPASEIKRTRGRTSEKATVFSSFPTTTVRSGWPTHAHFPPFNDGKHNLSELLANWRFYGL